MKKKTINSVITKKVNEWLESIEDEQLVKKIKNNIIITGGCITSMLLNEDVNDFDVYFRDKETTKLVAEYYCKKFNEKNANKDNKLGRPLHAWVLDGEDVKRWENNEIKLSDFAFDYPDISYSDFLELERTKESVAISSMITNTSKDRVKIIINSDGVAEDSDYIADENEYNVESYIEAVSDADEIPQNIISKEDNSKEKYRPLFLSTNAITLSDKMQLIVRFYGEPTEIHENYDFVHATNYWDSDTKKVELNERALEAILNKELFYVGSKYPIASLIRTRKFIKRGWQINAGQYLKMSFQISKLNLNDINVLEDQLVGVDSLYFLSFIKKMKESIKKSDKIDETLSGDYVISVIDTIFG